MMRKEEFLNGFECEKCGFICQEFNCPCNDPEPEFDDNPYRGMLL